MQRQSAKLYKKKKTDTSIFLAEIPCLLTAMALYFAFILSQPHAPVPCALYAVY